MERLSKRVGCGEAIIVGDIDICKPFIKAGLCKTGIMTHPDAEYGYQRHCNDTCILGKIIDRLAYYEDENEKELKQKSHMIDITNIMK